MKILSISAQKPTSTGSGVYLSELVHNWAAMGHRQIVVAGVAPEDPQPYGDSVRFVPVSYSSEVLPFPVLGMSDEMPYRSTRYRDLQSEQLSRFQAAFHETISRVIEEEQPDWIVCHHLYLLTALVRQWFPTQRIIGICHGSDLRQITKNPLQRELILRSIPKLDRIVALQQAQKSEILRIFSCGEEKVRVIGAGFNENIFYPPEPPVKVGPAKLIFAGKVTEKKGIFSLLRALDQLPFAADALQVILAGGHGDPEEFARIQQLAAHCRYPVEFPGSLPQQVLADRFRESDVFVLPSFFEGLPLVTMEALACGCRVVCSDLPGVREWFERNVAGHEVAFVPLPRRLRADEPVADQLPLFETRLAQAITAQLQNPNPPHPDLHRVSWHGTAAEILKLMNS